MGFLLRGWFWNTDETAVKDPPEPHFHSSVKTDQMTTIPTLRNCVSVEGRGRPVGARNDPSLSTLIGSQNNSPILRTNHPFTRSFPVDCFDHNQHSLSPQ